MWMTDRRSCRITPWLAAVADGVTGRLTGKANTRYRIQIFASAEEGGSCVEVTTALQPGFEPDAACVKTGGGSAFLAVQGETLVSEMDVTTDGGGVAQFSARTPANRMVAATATRLGGDGKPMAPSEFSQAVRSGKP